MKKVTQREQRLQQRAKQMRTVPAERTTKARHERLPGYIIDKSRLPPLFPTHMHPPKFWESLGRAVATFGFLEETLARAVYALTGTKKAPAGDAAVKAALAEWAKTLEEALTDTLSPLIDRFGGELRKHPGSRFEPKSRESLITDLRHAAKLRNVICHGSWPHPPDANGASVPFFVNRQLEVFEAKVDCAWLDRLRQHTAELVCEVMDAITHMGFQFPGSEGPGEPLTIPRT